MLFPASGTGQFAKNAAKIIRFKRLGCTNRPFYHIVVAERKKEQYDPVIEQVGTYDPSENKFNEKLCSLNLERIRYWIGNGADVSHPVSELLGLAGFYPVNPKSFMKAWRNRQNQAKIELTRSEQSNE